MHRLLQAIIPLFLLSLIFAGCSSDEDEDADAEPLDGWIITKPDGTKYLAKEKVFDTDSVAFNYWVNNFHKRRLR